ncbi:hypothetical protein FPJ98_09400 [Mycobacterium tuberculosis]|nr:hypothetical protein FPJ98_09400 [Mycobacterium tuberculosis]
MVIVRSDSSEPGDFGPQSPRLGSVVFGGQAVMVLMALSGGISATSAGFDETLELGGRTTAAGGR